MPDLGSWSASFLFSWLEDVSRYSKSPPGSQTRLNCQSVATAPDPTNPLSAPAQRVRLSLGPNSMAVPTPSSAPNVIGRRNSTSKLHMPTAASRARETQAAEDRDVSIQKRSASAQGRRSSLTQSRPGSVASRRHSIDGQDISKPYSSDTVVILRPNRTKEPAERVWILAPIPGSANVGVKCTLNDRVYPVTRAIDLATHPQASLRTYLDAKLADITTTESSSILVLQGPTSGGKSTFLRGPPGEKGYLLDTFLFFLATKASIDTQLHIFFGAIEVDEDKSCRDLITGKKLEIVRKGSGSQQEYCPKEDIGLLVQDEATFKILLESILEHVTCLPNGVHLGSSRRFSMFQFTLRVGSLESHKRLDDGTLRSHSKSVAIAYSHWVVGMYPQFQVSHCTNAIDTPGSEPLHSVQAEKPGFINKSLQALQLALSNVREALDNGGRAPAGITAHGVTRLLSKDLMNGAEVYTVVCLPPTVAGKLGSVTALDFATKLRLAAFQPTQQPGRPSSVMGRLDSRPVSDVLGEHRNGDRMPKPGDKTISFGNFSRRYQTWNPPCPRWWYRLESKPKPSTRCQPGYVC